LRKSRTVTVFIMWTNIVHKHSIVNIFLLKQGKKRVLALVMTARAEAWSSIKAEHFGMSGVMPEAQDADDAGVGLQAVVNQVGPRIRRRTPGLRRTAKPRWGAWARERSSSSSWLAKRSAAPGLSRAIYSAMARRSALARSVRMTG
jgi:hypothetical protein